MERLKVQEVYQLPKVKGGHIFNSAEFQALKPGEKKYFVLTEDDRPISRISFNLLEGKAISGHLATFGSIDFSPTLPLIFFTFFISEVVDSLKSYGIQKVIIRHWPLGYTLGYEEANYTMVGFTLLYSDVNQHLKIDHNLFVNRIDSSERSKLNQCIDRGFLFKQLTIEAFPTVYELIEDTHNRKGFPVSMSFNELSTAINSLPDKYLLFGIFDGDTLIAASVSVRISVDVLYNFYHADALLYRSNSPLVMLIGNIYQFCQKENIQLLDIGVSSDNGVINRGLFKFKKNMGCVTSKKLTYQFNYE